jgi:hypothetical protein
MNVAIQEKKVKVGHNNSFINMLLFLNYFYLILFLKISESNEERKSCKDGKLATTFHFSYSRKELNNNNIKGWRLR